MDLSNFINTYYRNLTLKHIDEYLDVPSYEGNSGKSLVVNSTENGIAFKDNPFYEFSEDFIKDGDLVSLAKKYLEYDDAVENYAKISHEHLKSEIVDFNEADYIHNGADEEINGIKTFSNQVYFKDNVFFEGERFQVDTENSVIKDNIITLNDNSENFIADKSGFEIFRGENEKANFLWVETDKKFKIGIGEDLKTILTEDDYKLLETELNNISDTLNAELVEFSADLQSNIDEIKKELSIEIEEKFINQTDNVIYLSNVIDTSKHLFVFKNGILQDKDDDFTIQDDNKSLLFEKILNTDKIIVKYSYKG